MKDGEDRSTCEDMALSIDDRQKVDFQVEYYKYRVSQFANSHSFAETEKTEMVRHLHQIENSIDTIHRYQQSSRDMPDAEKEWTDALSKSLLKSRDMLKVVIYYNDKDQLSDLTEQDQAFLRKIEIAATKCINNWKLPFKLRSKYFAN